MYEDEEVFGGEEEEEGFEEEPVDEQVLFLRKEISECFAVFDQKNTGRIPERFLHKALGALGIHLTPFEIEDLVQGIGKDGYIEYPDFQEYAAEKIKEVEPFDQLKAAFSVFDPDGEGTFPTERFRKWMTTLGDPLTEGEVKELCKMGDPTNQGLFSYESVVPVLIF